MTTKRNHSKKREEIYRALECTGSHPTAGMLYERLKETDPNIGIATVYRNLSVLEEEGSILSLGKIAGQERYDADTRPHGHFICSGCGSIFDFELPADCVSHDGAGLSSSGFVIKGCELRFSGLCPDCSGSN